jgi:hypothetical protein
LLFHVLSLALFSSLVNLEEKLNQMAMVRIYFDQCLYLQDFYFHGFHEDGLGLVLVEVSIFAIVVVFEVRNKLLESQQKEAKSSRYFRADLVLTAS